MLAHILGGREQPSLSVAGRRARPRHRRRRLLFADRARLRQIRRLRHAARSGKTLRDVEAAIDTAIADIRDHGVTADELSLRQEPAHRQRRLRYQAMLARWYGAALATGDVRDGWCSLSRRNSRRERRRGARGSQKTWLDSHASVTGYLVHAIQAEEKARVNNVTACARFGFRERFARLAAFPSRPCWLSPHRHSPPLLNAWSAPGASKAWLVREPAAPSDRHRLRLRWRRRAGRHGSWSRLCLTKAPENSNSKALTIASSAKRSS